MRISRLAPREREVAEIVCALGEASAGEIERALAAPLSNSAVRSMLSRLQAKGVLRRRREGKSYYYAAAGTEPAARDAALRRVARDHFGGSLAAAAAAMLALAHADLIRTGPSPRGGAVLAPRPRPDAAGAVAREA